MLLLLEAQPVSRTRRPRAVRARSNHAPRASRSSASRADARRRRRRGGLSRSVEQLAQRAQALQLPGAVEAIAGASARARLGPRSRGSAAFAGTSRWSRPPRWIVSPSIRATNLTTIVSRLACCALAEARCGSALSPSCGLEALDRRDGVGSSPPAGDVDAHQVAEQDQREHALDAASRPRLDAATRRAPARSTPRR